MGNFFDQIFAPITLLMQGLIKFFKNIPKLMKTLGETFASLIAVFPKIMMGLLNAGTILKTLIFYLSNPTKLFALIISLLMFIPILAVSIVYNIPLNTNYKLGDMFTYIVLLTPYSLFMSCSVVFWLVSKVLIEYIILGNCDKLLEGTISTFYYRNWLACENPPDSWYKSNGYHLNNKNESYLFAMTKCSIGYKPKGIFCEKMENYEPSYCEAAHIYREFVSTQDGVYSGLFYPSDLNRNSSSFMKKSLHEQEETIDKYKADVKLHETTCKVAHSEKDDLIKAICRKEDPKLEGLCHRNYCINGNEPFCHKFQNIGLQNSNIENRNVFVILKLLILILICVFVIRKKIYNM